ncbi:MAG: ATP-binding cassette domain-containing protein, partial [Spirochaetaceae bacterium]|nr:ATP-binding cassette domain-containing protein [Spirochaetaceae bacterium]
MIALRGIQKYFPSNGVTALDHADFDLRPGEIHALLGENGAGKSTLMHILAGHLIPGGGHIFIDGRETRFRSPADALAGGIGMVRQHPSLTPGFTVWEDCILGAEPRSAGYINRGTARKLVRALSERWHFDLPIDQPTGRLTVSQRQKAAVLALLFRNTKFLIFDEPTAVLSPLEAEGIFGLFRALRSGGKGIVLISHKLEETLGIADRVSVLRKGKTVAVMPAAALKPETLSALMFGGNTFSMEGLTQEIAQTTGTITLSVQNLSITAPGRPFIRGLSLDLPGGKILGIAGVRDSGLETLEL